MKRKKILIGLTIFIVVLFSAVLAAPYLFRDQIKATIDEQLAANINADVLFDIDNFSISLLTNFPNLTTSIKELGVVGRGEFAGEVLFAIDEFEVEVSLGKLLFDDQMSIQSISLTNPQIFIKVLPDGSANYDIMISTDEVEPDTTTAEATDFSIAIEKWQIAGGHIIYEDATIPTYIELENFNHTGSGNFSLSVFDLVLKTDVNLKEISYEGENYLSNRHFQADMILNMDLDQMKFTFKDNEFKLNDFAMGMDGWFSMPEEGFDMDLNISSSDNSFKSVLSLVPALYATDFDGLVASGSVDFSTTLKGPYSDDRMPAFTVNLGIKDGQFQYPDLPSTISNVQLKMLVDNKGGSIDNTKIDISTFHMELGKNPIDASLKIANLIDYPIDLKASAKINFAEMMQMFPMKGMELKGLLEADLKIMGVYSSSTSTIPASGNFNLSDFYYADEDNLPQGMSISTAIASFNPENISLDAFESKVGQSDFAATGKLSNYINYALKQNEVLIGNLNLTSNNILVDEFMTDTETEEEIIEADTTSNSEEEYDMAIPANIDFIMNANLKKIEYDGLLLTEAKGVIIIKDGILDMNNLSTKTLGGTIVFNGVYNTKDTKDPKFDMDLGIDNISIQESFKAFNTVQKLAPIAENMNGRLTTNFKMKGDLDNDLMPVTKTVNGGGVLIIDEATLKGSNFVSALSKLTSKGGKEEMTLKDISMDVTITNGAVSVAPFNVFIDGHKSNISGSTSIDGALDYKIATSVPAGQLGQQANAALAKLTGSTEEASSDIKLNLGVTGSYDSPKISLMGSDAKDAIKNQVTEAAVNKAVDLVKQNTGVDIPTSKEELNKEAIEKARIEADKLLAEAQKQADQVKEEARKAAEKVRAEAKVQNDKLIKEAGSNIFKKKGAEIAGKKLMQEADKNANKIEAEGTRQADSIMANAREKADTLIKNAESK
jgi:hypothetical protein